MDSSTNTTTSHMMELHRRKRPLSSSSSSIHDYPDRVVDPLLRNHHNHNNDQSQYCKQKQYSTSYQPPAPAPQHHLHNSTSTSSSSLLPMIDRRNIILFDLDCFYAQCYCIRLGYDVTITPLALFQWNSVLAVTYPARTLYNIMRGDTWDIVATKSKNQCLCVHVPISTISSSTTTNNDDGENDDPLDDLVNNSNDNQKEISTNHSSSEGIELLNDSVLQNKTKKKTLQDEYNELYQLSTKEQHMTRQFELNVRKYSTQGKANIEIFRIASAMILQLVHTCIQEYNNNNKSHTVSIIGAANSSSSNNMDIVLERASIDEFYVDVTQYVQQQQQQHHYPNHDQTDEDIIMEEAMKHTVIISKQQNNNDSTNDDRVTGINDIEEGEDDEDGDGDAPVHNQKDDDDNDDTIQRTLQHTCCIAYQIRQRVYTTLGFHMSAGISMNKTLAKLAASYGKPAGQAVLYPQYISNMLYTTPIKKVRHLGGKVGKQIMTLLPPQVPVTLGSVVQYVSLVQMKQTFSNNLEMAQKYYNLVRGIDHELVESKTPDSSAVLTKSITAFKSLRFSSSSSTSTTSTGSQHENNYNNNNNNNNNFANGHTLIEAMKWIDLLVKEIVSRVDRDTQRNERYPKSLVIQYYSHTDINTKYSHQNNKSIRISYPSYSLNNEAKIRLLYNIVPQTLQDKVVLVQKSPSLFRFHRIGLCATDFESIKNNNKGIDTYFSARAPTTTIGAVVSPPSNNCSSNKVNLRDVNPTSPAPITSTQDVRDFDEKQVIQMTEILDNANRRTTSTNPKPTTFDGTSEICPEKQSIHKYVENLPNKEEVDDDYIMAKKLQVAYDQEHRALHVMEKKRNKKLSSTMKQQQSQPRKINSFFQKK